MSERRWFRLAIDDEDGAHETTVYDLRSALEADGLEVADVAEIDDPDGETAENGT